MLENMVLREISLDLLGVDDQTFGWVSLVVTDQSVDVLGAQILVGVLLVHHAVGHAFRKKS